MKTIPHAPSGYCELIVVPQGDGCDDAMEDSHKLSLNTPRSNLHEMLRIHPAAPNSAQQALSDSFGSLCSVDFQESIDFDAASEANGAYSSSARGKKNQRVVSWSEVEIREYDVIVGDHPACRDGFPLSLDWSHSDQVIRKDISEFHERRSLYKRPLKLSLEDRKLRVGFEDYEEDEHKDNSEASVEASMSDRDLEQTMRLLQESLTQSTITSLPALSGSRWSNGAKPAKKPKKLSKEGDGYRTVKCGDITWSRTLMQTIDDDA